MHTWLQFTFGLGLACLAWISTLDTTGSPHAAPVLWAVTAAVAARLAFRWLTRKPYQAPDPANRDGPSPLG